MNNVHYINNIIIKYGLTILLTNFNISMNTFININKLLNVNIIFY